MDWYWWVLIALGVLFAVGSLGKSVEKDKRKRTPARWSKSSPRDYVRELSDLILDARLRQRIDSNHERVIQGLITEFNQLSGTPIVTRKAIVYVLGQIGDPSVLAFLDNVYRTEDVPGIKAAAGAAIAAINKVPRPKEGPDTRELERRQAIEEEYQRS